MNITSAVFQESGMIEAIIDGTTVTVPDDMGNRHRQELAEWETAGNEIAHYVPAAPVHWAVPKTTVVDRLKTVNLLDAAVGTVVNSDDPATVALLKAIGADPAVILAPDQAG